MPLQLTLDLPLDKSTAKSVTYWYVTRPCELDAALKCFRDHPTIGLDLETGGLTPFTSKIATLQLGVLNPLLPEDPHAVVIDVRAFTAEQLRPLFELLESKKITKIGQNIRFEYRFLRYEYGIRCRKLADTQVAEMIIRAGLLSPKNQTRGKNEERQAYKHCSMSALTTRYLQLDIDKDTDLRTSFYSTPVGQHSLRQIVYAASDVVYPFLVAKEQRKLIEERGLRGIIKVEMDLIPILGEMEHQGIRVDKQAWRVLWQEALQKRAEAERALDDIIRPYTMQPDLFDTEDSKQRPIYPKAGRPMNYSSAEQVKWALKKVCEGRRWHHRVVIDESEVLELRERFGKEWRRWNEEKGRKVTAEDIPDWVIPEDEFCILTDADKNTLQLRKCRNQLPADLVDLFLTYSKYDIRCDTFGNDWLVKHVNPTTGRLHPEIHQATTNTGRLSTSPNCYDASTEILTRRGWVKFPELSVEDEVAQVDPNSLAVSFVVPSDHYSAPYQGEMIAWSSEQVDLLVTPHHRMLVGLRSGRNEVIRADEWVKDRKHYHAGTYAGGQSELTTDEVRWLVAVQADGSWSRGGIDFTFKKSRKARRLQDILDRLGVPDQPGFNEETGKYRVRISQNVRITELAEYYLGSEKRFGSWINELSREALDAFVDEVWAWDGLFERQTMYCSKDRVNADWVATACALSGIRARLRPYTKESKTYWQVDTANRNYSWTTGVTATTKAYAGTVHCVTVPTGMVLVRRETPDGRVVMSVSGNTQNIPSDDRYRKCFVPRPGFKFVICDYSQQEPRLLAQVSKDPVYLGTYHRNDDLYLSVAEAMLGHRPDKKTEEGKLERKIFKAVVLAMAYRSGARKLRDQLTLGLVEAIMSGLVPAPSFEYAQELHKRFFEVHEKVLEYQNLCSNGADPRRKESAKIWDQFAGALVTYVRAPCGRLRFFPPDAKNTYTEGANAPIQGGSATMTKAAACLIQRMIDEKGWQDLAFIVNLVHDEVVSEVHESIAEEYAVLKKQLMEEAGRFYCPDVPIAAEFPENSNGVVDWWAKEIH